MLWSECNLKTCVHVRNMGYPVAYRSGAQKPPTISQLNGNFYGLYRRNETWYGQSYKGVGTYEGLLHRLKISWTFVHKRVKIVPDFSPTLRKFCVLFRCQVLHTANGTQPNFVKWKEVNGAGASRIRWHRIVNVNETIEKPTETFAGETLRTVD